MKNRVCFGRLCTHLGSFGLAASVLSACVFFENPEDRQIEKSPNFKAGYSDGCESANTVSANMREQSDVRDRALFKSDRAYRTGWSAGYTACRPANLQMPEPNQGPIADPYPPR
jgi:hypothetical protein